MTDLQKLVWQWSQEAGPIRFGNPAHLYMEKFARLAMQHAAQEAAKVADAICDARGTDYGHGYNQAALDCARAIREHFKTL